MPLSGVRSVADARIMPLAVFAAIAHVHARVTHSHSMLGDVSDCMYSSVFYNWVAACEYNVQNADGGRSHRWHVARAAGSLRTACPPAGRRGSARSLCGCGLVSLRGADDLVSVQMDACSIRGHTICAWLAAAFT